MIHQKDPSEMTADDWERLTVDDKEIEQDWQDMVKEALDNMDSYRYEEDTHDR